MYICIYIYICMYLICQHSPGLVAVWVPRSPMAGVPLPGSYVVMQFFTVYMTPWPGGFLVHTVEGCWGEASQRKDSDPLTETFWRCTIVEIWSFMWLYI